MQPINAMQYGSIHKHVVDTSPVRHLGLRQGLRGLTSTISGSLETGSARK